MWEWVKAFVEEIVNMAKMMYFASKRVKKISPFPNMFLKASSFGLSKAGFVL